MTLSVFLLHPPDEQDLTYLRKQLEPGITVELGPELPEPASYQVLVAGRPQRKHLDASPALHSLVIPWAGLPVETRSLLNDYPRIAVHNLHHNAAPVTELALALLLAAAKFIVPLDQSLRRHDWTPRYQPSQAMLLKGKTALILGYGAIGQRIAQACLALGMDVLATRRSGGKGEEAIAVYTPDALADLLPQAHVLIIALPLTSETEGLIGQSALDLLPPGAVLVNIGRGPVVEQQALYQALTTGKLRAAGIDVWYRYPEDEESRSNTPPADYPFHELDNVVISPHRGGATEETDRLRMTYLAQLINALAVGKHDVNQVDVEIGY